MLSANLNIGVNMLSDYTGGESSTAMLDAVSASKEWLAEDILCYRFHDSDRTTVDWCANDLRRELRQWPNGRPLRLLLDLRAERMIVGVYALRRAREIAQLRPDISGQTAVLVTHPVTARIIGTAIRLLPNSFRQRIVLCCEPDAIAWLRRRGTMVPVSPR